MRIWLCGLLLFIAPLLQAEEEADPLAAAIVTTPRAPSAGGPPKGGRYVVAIDVGHSERHPGAISATGLPEYQFNLRVAKRLEAALAATGNIRPFIITSAGTELTLPGRSKIAADNDADLLISIHHDAAQPKYMKSWEVEGKKQRYSDDFAGYGVFVSRKHPTFDDSFELARAIGRAMSAHRFPFAKHHAEPVRGENRPIIDEDAGVYAFDDLVVLKTARMPAVLVECGVIVNREEEQSLLTVERQAAIAAAVVRGVNDYFAATTSRRTAPPPTGAPDPALKKYPKPGTPLSPGEVRNNTPR